MTNREANTVSVIDTASNKVVATIGLPPAGPFGIAVTPDGKHAYITNEGSNTVSAIDTTANKVVATVPVGVAPQGVGIMPPPVGVPFLAFNATLAIDLDRAPKEDRFADRRANAAAAAALARAQRRLASASQ